MKKVVSVKEILIVLISVIIITIANSVFAVDIVLGDNTNDGLISANEYENAQNIMEEVSNNTVNNVTNNTINNIVNNSVKKYNTNNTTGLPQTGIEDYNIGILLIICIASAIYAYRKINDYKSI